MTSSAVDGPPGGAPVAERERQGMLDLLRGFALLGIFLMNVEFFTRPMQAFTEGVAPASGVDYAVAVAIYVLVQGKFWVLFALLFGMGFALMRDRAVAAGRPFVGVYLRRTALLGLFGAAHIVLLWVGDILLSYALSALFLLMFMGLRGTAAWLVGAALYLLVSGFWLLSGVGMMVMPQGMTDMVRQEMASIAVQAAQAAAVYADGTFMAVTRQRLSDYAFLFTGAVVFQIPMILGVFLVGAWLAGTGRLADASAHRRFFAQLAIGGLLLGGLILAASLSFGVSFDLVDDVATSTVAIGLMALANLPLALGYLGLFVLAACGPLRGALGWLAPAGRMALTNYLLQSVVASLVFYGYGLGLFGEVGRAAQVALVLVVFIAQVAFSRWWLARFHYGPMEWLWRAGTYLRWPPMRRSTHA